MKVTLAFVLFIAVASAVAVPAKGPTFEQKNEVLKKALVRLVKEKQIAKEGCGVCVADIAAAVTDCGALNWLKCVTDILGAGNPCIHCVCDVIGDVCGILGCDL